jgi:hypothetical protein
MRSYFYSFGKTPVDWSRVVLDDYPWMLWTAKWTWVPLSKFGPFSLINDREIVVRTARRVTKSHDFAHAFRSASHLNLDLYSFRLQSDHVSIHLLMVLACQVDECHVPATIVERAKSNVIMQCLVVAARAITWCARTTQPGRRRAQSLDEA